MSNSYTFAILLLFVLIQAIASFELINDEQDETKLDDIRQVPASSYYSSSGNQGSGPECLAKSVLSNMLSRSRRASISRPYFHHWRGSRDSRYASKNLLAFSPRLGKRADDDESQADDQLNKRQAEEEIHSPELDAFLLTLAGYLPRKKINIIYEDATKICLSEVISDTLIKEVLEKIENNRRKIEEQQEARERHAKNKHPLLFRYRLG